MSTQPNIYQQEYLDKKGVQSQLEQHYTDQTTKNGLEPLTRILKYLPDEYQTYHFSRQLAFAHLDFEKILERVANKQEFAIVSGLNSSSHLHLGHKALFDLLLFLQKIGGRIFIPLTNDETVVDGKLHSLSESRKIAYESILPDLLAMGFDPMRTHIFVISDYPEIYNFAMYLNQYVSLKEIEAAFGKESLSNPGQIFYRAVVQMAQILLPQLPEFGGPQPTLIPVGIDQHPYLLLARDVAKRLKLIPPSELVLKFQPSLKDPSAKMSGSKPDTAIYLSDDTETIKKKINKAYTGAVSSLEMHQKLGGVPEICSVFSLFKFHNSDETEVQNLYLQYKKGAITMGELKERASDFVVKMLEEHNKRKQGIGKTQLEEVILTKKLSSFLEYK